MRLRSRIPVASALLGLACTSNIEGAAPGAAGDEGVSGASSAGTAGAPGAGASSLGGSSGQGGSGGTSTGGSGSTSGTGPVVPDPPPFQPAPGMLRRLTRTQFRNALHDVFAVDVDVSDLDPDSWNGNFAVIGAATVVTPERGVEQYHTAVEAAVDAVFADNARRATFIGCTPGTGATDACVRDFLERLGRRAWRRPLDTAELDRLATLSAGAATELGSAYEGVRWATVALFTSPNFLYRAELGAPDANGQLRFTGYETASRLAFLAWNSLPDGALLDQAGAGVLTTADGVREEATRLLDAPAGREAIGAFAEEYLRLDRIATQAKDPTLFPEYGTALQAAMARDMRGTWEAIAFDDRVSALELLTTTKVVVNRELAQLYGLGTSGLDSTTFQSLTLPADSPRVGILGKAAFLSQFANQKEGSPTLRGKFIREALMCTPIQPPPPNVNTVLAEPPPDAPMTKRERLERHRTDAACAGCHSQMDPMGLPLEIFDAIGRYRTLDNGLPIDPSGEFDERPVADAKELGLAMTQSLLTAQCIVRKYYAYATGHEERDVDGSAINAIADSFQRSGFQLRDLVLDVVTHEAFATVAPQP